MRSEYKRCPDMTMWPRADRSSAASSRGCLLDGSSLIALLSQSGAVVAHPGQGHRLVAGGAQRASLAVSPVRAAIAMLPMASLDTRLASTQGLHLFFGGYLWGAKDGSVPPFEVTAIRVMPQPRLSSRERAVEVHRVDHVPDVWMFNRARHGITLRVEGTDPGAGLLNVRF